MSKFDKLVEIAKESIEKEIFKYVEEWGIECLPIEADVSYAILFLGSELYQNLLLSAGYSSRTIKRKVENMDYDRLANRLNTWYETELYPKLYNTFQSQGKTIYDV